MEAQVAQDNKDLPVALAANQAAGSDEALQAAAVVSSILKISVLSLPAPTQTQEAGQATTTASEAVATSDAAGNNNNSGNNNDNNDNNSNDDNGSRRNRNGNGRSNNKRSAQVFVA